MRQSLRVLAIAMTVVVAVSVAGASVATTGVGTVTETAESNGTDSATNVSQCRVIEDSGQYELTTDLRSDASACIEIQAANVNLDGNGHSVTSTDGDGTGILVRAGFEPPLESPANATITNLTVAEWSDGVRFEGGDNGTVTDVTAVGTSISLGSTAHGTVADSRVENGTVAAGLGANDVVIRSTTLDDSTVNFGASVTDSLVSGVSGDGASVYVTQSENVTVRNNSLQEVYLSDVDHVTVADNRPDDSGRFGVWIASTGAGNVTITGNTITGNTANASRSDGIRAQSVHNLTVTHNTITGNEDGIVVLEITDRDESYQECRVEDTSTVSGSVEVHANALANNTHGIVNEDTTIVNAVSNYWGASDGPASATSQPLEDPKTGELADGDGTTVSEDPNDAGVSNVRFDQWLDDDPTTDSQGNETAAN